MPFCVNCGAQLQETNRFCSGCGSPSTAGAPAPGVSMPGTVNFNFQQTQPQEEEEIEYYSGHGKLIVKRTEHRGAGRKYAAAYFGGGLGYLAFGRDKTRKSEAEGTIVITNKALYCAGNDYPFDRILSITKEKRRSIVNPTKTSQSIVLTFEKDVGAGGRADGGIAGVGGMSIEIELITEDIDGLFQGLERAKLHKVKLSSHNRVAPNSNQIASSSNSVVPSSSPIDKKSDKKSKKSKPVPRKSSPI